jgi:hypothetical protein
MRILMPCMECLAQNGVPNLQISRVEVQDSGLYQTSCSRGHLTTMVLQQLRFEVLSEFGANAIVDGYYREAIASFTAAMERFNEFYIAAICRKHGVNRTAITSTWKRVSRRSEQQLGAFQFLCLIETGQVPPLFPDDQVSLRNDVIHGGRFPNREEAIAYAQAVVDLLTPLIADIKRRAPDQVQALVLEHLGLVHSLAGDERRSSQHMTTAISLINGGAQPSIAASLERIVQMRMLPA